MSNDCNFCTAFTDTGVHEDGCPAGIDRYSAYTRDQAEKDYHEGYEKGLKTCIPKPSYNEFNQYILLGWSCGYQQSERRMKNYLRNIHEG